MGGAVATIKDVALAAGVSKATVSYVINQKETSIRISEETRNRIQEAARQLNFRPNALARGLVKKRTDSITLVMQFPAIFSGWSGFIIELMRGMAETAIRLGYDMMLHTKEQPDIEREIAALTDGRVDGALLLRDMDDPLAKRLDGVLPCVLIFGRGIDASVWYVDCDNVAGGRIATDRLLDLGHRSILHLTGTRHSSAAVDRQTGFEQALGARGIAVRADWICQAPYAGADFSQVVAALRAPDRPTAVFAWSDEAAVQLMTLAREIGLRIPEDLSVIGFDSTEWCNHTTPPLTSVRQPVYEMAAYAFELLTRRIEGESIAETRVLFTPSLEPRGSCAARN